MDAIERCAQESVLRALGFAGLAIGMVMMGLSFDPILSFRTGSGLTLLVTVILVLKALRAVHCNVRRTEVWLLLGGKTGLPFERAERVIRSLLRRLYLRYAQVALAIAVAFWILALLFRLAGA